MDPIEMLGKEVHALDSRHDLLVGDLFGMKLRRGAKHEVALWGSVPTDEQDNLCTGISSLCPKSVF